MKTAIAVIILALFSAIGTAAQTTTDCHIGLMGDTIHCATNSQPDWSDLLGQKERAARRAAQQQAAATIQQAEALCVSGGGVSYKGHCLTQDQYAAAKQADVDYHNALEAARIAKFAAQDARDAKKDAEKEAKAARKRAEKDAKNGKKLTAPLPPETHLDMPQSSALASMPTPIPPAVQQPLTVLDPPQESLGNIARRYQKSKQAANQ